MRNFVKVSPEYPRRRQLETATLWPVCHAKRSARSKASGGKYNSQPSYKTPNVTSVTCVHYRDFKAREVIYTRVGEPTISEIPQFSASGS